MIEKLYMFVLPNLLDCVNEVVITTQIIFLSHNVGGGKKTSGSLWHRIAEL